MIKQLSIIALIAITASLSTEISGALLPLRKLLFKHIYSYIPERKLMDRDVDRKERKRNQVYW